MDLQSMVPINRVPSNLCFARHERDMYKLAACQNLGHYYKDPLFWQSIFYGSF
jgi:hypothetical protein